MDELEMMEASNLPENIKEGLRQRFKRYGTLQLKLLPRTAVEKMLRLMEENEEDWFFTVDQLHEDRVKELVTMGNLTHYAVFAPLGLFTHYWDATKEEWVWF